MEYPLYNEHGIKIGSLTTSNPIPQNTVIKISDNKEYFAITNTTEERLSALVEQNLEVLRKDELVKKDPTRTCNKCRVLNATDDEMMICGVSYGYLCLGCRGEYQLLFDTDEKFRETCYRRSGKKSRSLTHYCMECEKMVAVRKVKEGSLVYDTMCIECRGDDLTEVSEEEYKKMMELEDV